MIVAEHERPEACIAVVALGWTPRLVRGLTALSEHVSSRRFTVIAVVNPHAGRPDASEFPAVRVVAPEANLGWAGGLHLARSLTDAPLLIAAQDDMRVADGWLDELLAAADRHPEFAVLGSRMIAADGGPDGYNGGRAEPADDVASWNRTDDTRFRPPTEVTEYDWVTSKGMAIRTSVWDEVGGPDPRNYPLNHVDKELCTHLRAHGHRVALAPDARLYHEASQSAPSEFRVFLTEWQEPRFNARWGDTVARLAGKPGVAVAHECADWRRPDHDVIDDVERAVGIEASRMLVTYATWSRRERDAAVAQARAEEREESNRRLAEFARISARATEEARAATARD